MASSRRSRILIVDDSAAMRSLIRAAVTLDPSCEVAGVAVNGQSALDMVEALRPDLILLDVEMPVMDGLVTLRTLRERGHRMPVIMCSSLTQRGARVTLEALSAGASDYVAKPSGQDGVTAALQTLSQELGPRIQALTAASVSRSNGSGAPREAQIHSRAIANSSPTARPASTPTVLVVGVSTGGPAVLDVLLPALPADFPLPVLIVQHMPDLFTRFMAERLGGRCSLCVQEAAEGAEVQRGNVHIARGNWHLEVRAPLRSGLPATLHLNQAPPENHCRPAADVLFRSAAAAYGAGVLALVLTGMGHDGLDGCRAIRESGGWVLVQDRSTSAVWGMPRAVAEAGMAERILPLPAIVPELLRLTRGPQVEARALKETAV
ncbi:MAG TPA: chemotaxis response regulator protein-glutamate methylesterase [Terracidiphilus sp.]|nr:chemotaxis response regulator protein-glutamate methylesterase [Terracidiphilus sp.]